MLFNFAKKQSQPQQPQAAIFQAPLRPQKKVEPIVLTDDRVKAIFAKIPQIILNDAAVAVAGKIIGWKHTREGTLGAIIVNPVTDLRYHYVIDFKTGRARQYGAPWAK